MDSGPRNFQKIFLSFPGRLPTKYTLLFFISKKSLKFDGGYYTEPHLTDVLVSISSLPIAQLHHFNAALAPGQYFDAAPAPPAPSAPAIALTLLYSKPIYLKQTKVKIRFGAIVFLLIFFLNC
jgi:hypothetical protein